MTTRGDTAASLPSRLATLGTRIGRCPDLDTLVGAALAGLAELFGYEHSLLLLLDESGTRLYTIASHGYAAQGVGSEVQVGDGIIGMVGARCEPMRIGNLRQMLAYARTVRRAVEEHGGDVAGRDIPLPGLADAASQVAVPAMAMGQLVGVLAIESPRRVAFGPDDEDLLTVVATMIANAIEIEWARESVAGDSGTGAPPPAVATAAAPAGGGPTSGLHVRFFAVDGSTFLDGEYLIKGVAGRLLWSLLQQHAHEGREHFTNKEVRLDPTLELPEFRDNLESRLILLKRRLDERGAPIRIEKTGRGRFRLIVDVPLVLDPVDSAG